MKAVNQHDDRTALRDRLAGHIAQRIIRYQVKLSDLCAKKFNNYSVRKKKVLFIMLLSFAAVALVTGIFTDLYTIPSLKQGYKPATHIGRASDIRSDGHAALTDSLTNNH